MTYTVPRDCPVCHHQITKITHTVGGHTIYDPCGHAGLFTSLRSEEFLNPMMSTYETRPVLDPWAEVVRLTNLLNSVKESLRGLDLVRVRDRYQSARLAGTDAEDAGNGWDPAKTRALQNSWQDVSKLHDTLLVLKKRLDVK